MSEPDSSLKKGDASEASRAMQKSILHVFAVELDLDISNNLEHYSVECEDEANVDLAYLCLESVERAMRA